MKPQNKKPDDAEEERTEGGDITQLDGSPDPTAVSKVAMGQKPETLDKHDDIYNTQWIQRLMGGKPAEKMGGQGDAKDEINRAYALLFEGLAGLARINSDEECEEDDSSEEDQSEEDDKPTQQGCDCCDDKQGCDCGDCEDC